MNRLFVFALVAVVAMVAALDDCSAHPFRNYILANHKVTNKGLSCIIEPITQSGCFETEVVKVADLFVKDNQPIAMDPANPICEDIQNTCIAADQTQKFMEAWQTYATVYRTALDDVFKYEAEKDEGVRTLLEWVLTEVVKLVGGEESKVGKKIVELLDIDEFEKLIKVEIVKIFDQLHEYVKPLLTGLHPLWESVAMYSKGMSCLVADADIDTKFKDSINGSIVTFNQEMFTTLDIAFGGAVTDDDGKINLWVQDIQKEILAYYGRITDTIDGFVTGIDFLKPFYEGLGKTNGIVKELLGVDIKVYIATHIQAPKLFTKIAEQFFNCLFPMTPDGYCVPFLDQISWFIDGLTYLFKGDFKTFWEHMSDGFEGHAKPVVTPASLGEEFYALGSEMPQVTKTENGGIDLIERSGTSNVSIDTKPADPNSTEGDGKKILIFGKEYDQKLVFMAAGGVGALLIIMIICCACCCKSKPAYPPMMGGMPPMGGMMAPPSMGMRGGMGGPPSMGMQGPPSFGGPARGGPMSMGMRGRPF